jgi:general secretion pathway protein G
MPTVPAQPTKKEDRKRRRVVDAGFTLLEIMVVLAIIALIAGGVGAAVFKQFKKAQIQTAKMRVKAARDATAQFMMDNSNACPKGIDELLSQKYLDKNNGKDPWGKELIFRCPGTNDTDSADISSAGPDRQEGSGDDIKSWEL